MLFLLSLLLLNTFRFDSIKNLELLDLAISDRGEIQHFHGQRVHGIIVSIGILISALIANVSVISLINTQKVFEF